MSMHNFNPNQNSGNNNAGNGGGNPNMGGFSVTGTPGGGNKPSGGKSGYPVDDDFDPNEYLINFNERHKNDMPIMFRDALIQQTISCLIGKFKPNALLIGPAGTGKTKIAEDIARRIANNDPLIPARLQGCTIWELPISNIVSGSGLVGEIERKTKNIINFASNPANKVILFIDEIHMLAGESQTYDKIAQIMKPALARGDMKVIGATTTQESQDLVKDPAFNRRFTRLIVDELNQEQTKAILQQMSVSMFKHYETKVALNDQVISEVVAVADEYTTCGSHRPDNAITLLDRAMADAYIHRKVLEQQAINDPNLAATLSAIPAITLSKSQMRETAMRIMTGNAKKTMVDIDVMKKSLEPIRGQDETIAYLLDTLERNMLELNIDRNTKPLTLLFTGSSGVGKTAIAKILAKELTGVKPITLNMTEYHDAASINRIIGSPDGYVGSDSKKELPFDILDSNPYQVILLDEFEKADRSVQRLFMSAFDEGYIKTSKGKTVDFSKAIIIATTNAGYTGVSSTMGFTNNGQPRTSVSDMSKYFDTELLNRFTDILHFNPITETLFHEILTDSYKRYVAKVKDMRSSYRFLPDTMGTDDADRLTKENYAREFGARHIDKIVRRYVEDLVLANKRAKQAAAANGNGIGVNAGDNPVTKESAAMPAESMDTGADSPETLVEQATSYGLPSDTPDMSQPDDTGLN